MNKATIIGCSMLVLIGCSAHVPPSPPTDDPNPSLAGADVSNDKAANEASFLKGLACLAGLLARPPLPCIH